MELNPLKFDSTPGIPAKDMRKGSSNSRASFSVSSVSSHVNTTPAMSSIYRVGQDQVGLHAVSSISRIGQDSHVSTSIAHPDSGNVKNFDDGIDQDAVRDQLRYQHIRKSIRERKATEAAVAQATRQTSKFNTGIDTSSPGFLRKGPRGIERHLYRIVRQQRATLKNISKADQQKFLDIVESHIRATQVGHGVSRIARRSMIKDLRKEYTSGTISKADFKDMKKMVNQLPKRKGFFGV
ncbi:MAG: hypothetical protein HYV41_04430 [Candidatus Magasanikbacteria bacterium]|nr:hypothetical protein [Candidatus Magasanikbacteria bacterium]